MFGTAPVADHDDVRFVVRIDRPDPPEGVILPDPDSTGPGPRVLPFAGWLALLGHVQRLLAAVPPAREDDGDGGGTTGAALR